MCRHSASHVDVVMQHCRKAFKFRFFSLTQTKRVYLAKNLWARTGVKKNWPENGFKYFSLQVNLDSVIHLKPFQVC